MPHIQFAELTEAGNAHGVNEDAVAHWPLEGGLVLAVADGIGDRTAGHVASTHALAVVGRELAAAADDLPILSGLRRAVQAANVELYQKSVAVPELRGMGTTLTVTAVVGSSLVSAHVGDCRLWLLRDGRFTQLTKDHTWAWAHLPGTGLPEHPQGHPRRYSLPRCLGHELIVSIDLLSLELRARDVLLQCSDGIHGPLEEAEIHELLEAHPPEAACRAILRRAREEDGSDDRSVQVATVAAFDVEPARSWWRLGR